MLSHPPGPREGGSGGEGEGGGGERGEGSERAQESVTRNTIQNTTTDKAVSGAFSTLPLFSPSSHALEDHHGL